MTKLTDNRSSEADNPGWIEWATGLVSAGLVIAMITWVTWEALTAETKPPEFSISVTNREMVEGGYRVTFDIANRSAQTASAVVVRGEILDGGNVAEDAEVTFDYVPAQSQARGAIFFSRDPGEAEMRVRPVGYTTP
jgi:uncharacterized protein (TIGR02588 family)